MGNDGKYTRMEDSFHRSNQLANTKGYFCMPNKTKPQWDEFVATPSRLSAEQVNREERARLLEQVSAKGFISNYK